MAHLEGPAGTALGRAAAGRHHRRMSPRWSPASQRWPPCNTKRQSEGRDPEHLFARPCRTAARLSITDGAEARHDEVRWAEKGWHLVGKVQGLNYKLKGLHRAAATLPSDGSCLATEWYSDFPRHISNHAHRKHSAMHNWVSMRGSFLARRASPGVRGAGAQEGEGPDHVGQLLGLEAVPVAQAVQADGLQQLRARVVKQPREAPHTVGCVLQGMLHRVSTSPGPSFGEPHASRQLPDSNAGKEPLSPQVCADAQHCLKVVVPRPRRVQVGSY